MQIAALLTDKYQEIEESLQAIASWSLQTGQARQSASRNESLPGSMVAPASPSPCEFQRGDYAPLNSVEHTATMANHIQNIPKYCKTKQNQESFVGFKTF